MRILSIGELIFDVLPAGEFIGGAPLNFAYHAARLGHEVALASAVGEDGRGDKAFEFASRAGIESRFIQRTALAPTGVVRVQVTASGEPSYILERPAAYNYTSFGEAQASAVADWNPEWIYYGTLFQCSPAALSSSLSILNACPHAKRFYDVNLRAEHHDPELLLMLAARASILKLNQEEVAEVGCALGASFTTREEFARKLASRFHYHAVCITLGAEGCAILANGRYVECPPSQITVVDAIGAGDAFAAAFLDGWTAGGGIGEIGGFANRVGALIASRAGGTPLWSPADLPA